MVLNPHTIRFRLTAVYAATMTLLLILAGVGVLLGIHHAVEDTVDLDLRTRVKVISGLMTQEKIRAANGFREKVLEQAPAAPGGLRLRIEDAAGPGFYDSAAVKDWPPASITGQLPRRGKAWTILMGNKAVRLLAAPVPGGVVQIGASIDEFGEMETQFRWILTLASPLLLIVSSVMGYWMSGRALKPVDDIALSARRIGGQNLSERLYCNGTGDELDRLATTLNEMLGRLEAAFQKITQFTADASHELRTPVAIMRTTAEVIAGKPRTVEEHEKGWEKIIAQSERTSRLIDDLLLLARADAGRENLQFEVVDLSELLRDVAEEVRILADVSRLGLTLNISCEPRITGDAEALRRLLLILLDNAIKYTPAEGQVTVGLAVRNTPGQSVILVSVRDTGIGIAAENLPYVFDRFYRTSRDRSRTTGGAGLGLSIAQWIAVRHGGHLTVESSLGSGSVFSLSFSGDLQNRDNTVTPRSFA